ncbi:tRNA adenosine(34) deaminase TadA [Nodosilinea sp. PGN35]|uniref:tRNA adenosine(34) deaminase TadA n=1 Tax=Nodosilinea sp. PGN35 TaxID=3020489 RepID=UPI0023B2A9AA|nr:tRNA adenosine(34) deaminase TadA [Nodosilinea sp. TSF1-S3]MDF0370079.1 tRNA adenosine(34) deaminase TadA [Nodosilinea sp. TSF1-S3]
MSYDLPAAPADETALRHHRWMLRALELAEAAGAAGDVPVGAVVVGPGDRVLAEVGNRREQDQDPTAHAEVLALREAARRLGNWHLNDCTLYVTLEPCPMCAGAIVLSRLGLLVYGTPDPKSGAVRSVLNLPDSPASNHRLTVVTGVLAEPCRQQLQRWFQQRRRENRRPPLTMPPPELS